MSAFPEEDDAAPSTRDLDVAGDEKVIVIDTSALMAIINREADAGKILHVLSIADHVLMSAGTLVECHVVSVHRRVEAAMRDLLDLIHADVVPVDAAMAETAGRAYAEWGKSKHPARLNFGDCFAYALAISRGLPLLYVGGDFAQTDVRSAL